MIDKVCEKLGYDPDTDRTLLVSIINSAAKEVYESTDLPGSLREITCLVPPSSIIALPYFVGELRAMRQTNSRDRLGLREMVSRYSFQPWSPDEIWRAWRVMQKSPTKNSIVNAAVPITLSRHAAETDEVSVTIVGATENSARVEEVALFQPADLELQLQTPFIYIHSITKTTPNTFDIVFTGADQLGAPLELAVIPNDRLESTYTIVDVSEYPSGGEVGGSTWYIDVLYKQPLFSLFNDGDTFPCEGFDDAIVYKVLEHEYSEKPDGGQKALGYYEKCNQVINQRVNHSNGTTQKEIIFGPSQYFDLYPANYPVRMFGVTR